jgi:hypothetical protein
MTARGFLYAVLAATLAGCGAAPFDYHSPSEIQRGPGLLSGKEGAFVLTLGKAAPPTAAAPYQLEDFERWRGSAEGSDEYREFQDWREWREWKRRHAH